MKKLKEHLERPRALDNDLKAIIAKHLHDREGDVLELIKERVFKDVKPFDEFEMSVGLDDEKKVVLKPCNLQTMLALNAYDIPSYPFENGVIHDHETGMTFTFISKDDFNVTLPEWLQRLENSDRVRVLGKDGKAMYITAIGSLRLLFSNSDTDVRKSFFDALRWEGRAVNLKTGRSYELLKHPFNVCFVRRQFCPNVPQLKNRAD